MFDKNTDLNFETVDQFFDWIKGHILAEVTNFQDIDDVEIDSSKSAQDGRLDLDAFLRVRVKDKVEGHSIVVGDEVKKFIEKSALETPANMHLSEVEFVRRQKWRFDGALIVATIPRPKQRAWLENAQQTKPSVFIGERNGIKTPFLKQLEIPAATTFTIRLTWL
jgi:hypothetical protein